MQWQGHSDNITTFSGAAKHCEYEESFPFVIQAPNLAYMLTNVWRTILDIGPMEIRPLVAIAPHAIFQHPVSPIYLPLSAKWIYWSCRARKKLKNEWLIISVWCSYVKLWRFNRWLSLPLLGIFTFWDSPPLITCQMRTVWSFYKIPKGGGRRELLVCWMSAMLSFRRAGTDCGTHEALFFQPSKPYGMGKAIGPHGTIALGRNLTPKGQRYTSNLIQEEILSS